MRPAPLLRFALLTLLLVAGPARALTVQQLLGTWTTPEGNRTLTIKNDGTYVVNGQQFKYVLQNNVMMATGGDGNVYVFQLRLEGGKLLVDDGASQTVTWTRKLGGGLGGGLGGMAPAKPKPAPVTTSSGGTTQVQVGFSMTPAPGFSMHPDRSKGMMFTNPNMKGVVIIAPMDALTPQLLASANRKGYKDASMDVKAVSPGAHQKIKVGMGSGYYFSIRGNVGGPPIEGFMGGIFGPNNTPRMMLMAFAQPQNWARFKPHARKMLDSIRLKPPQKGDPNIRIGDGAKPAARAATRTAAPPVGQLYNNAKAKEWVDKLKGKRARHRSSHSSVGYGGGPSGFSSSSFYWDLCSDGTFYSSNSSAVSVGGSWGGSSAHGGNSGRGAGRWQVVGLGGDEAKIVFREPSGKVEEYKLSKWWNQTYNFYQTYFDNTKMYLVDENQVCE